MNHQYWEFILVGKNHAELHGVTLREQIRYIATKYNIEGIVENIKENGTVRVFCKTVGSENAKSFFEKILGIEDLIAETIDPDKSKMARIIYEPAENAPGMNGFLIKKSDELTEMVWALKGAGRVFAVQEKKRMQFRQETLSKALSNALRRISDCAQELTLDINSNRRFFYSEIETFLQEAPNQDEELLDNLYTLRDLCSQANNSLYSGKGIDNLGENFEKIIRTCQAIDEKMRNERHIKKK